MFEILATRYLMKGNFDLFTNTDTTELTASVNPLVSNVNGAVVEEQAVSNVTTGLAVVGNSPATAAAPAAAPATSPAAAPVAATAAATSAAPVATTKAVTETTTATESTSKSNKLKNVMTVVLIPLIQIAVFVYAMVLFFKCYKLKSKFNILEFLGAFCYPLIYVIYRLVTPPNASNCAPSL